MRTQKPHPRPIIISEQKHGLPYSKGLMASSIMATGLSPAQAYRVASLVEDRLREAKRFSVSLADVRALAREIVAESFGEPYADKYDRWDAIARLDRPLVVLVGGTTGVGKSTISTSLAQRLGITRIVSTDAIREVMRSIFSKDLMPLLYESSFTAWRALRVPLPKTAEPVIVGFREQTEAVMVGVSAIIRRALEEGLDMIVEGVHLVPGEIPRSVAERGGFIVPMIVTVEDEHLHRSHFYIRELETDGYRPFKRYRANFEAIRQIGEHLVDQAHHHGVPVLDSRQLDATINQALEHVMHAVMPSHADEPHASEARG